MGISIMLGSVVFALGVVVQLIAIVALLRFLERRDRLALLTGSLWTSAGALSGAMLIVFAGHLVQVGLWAGLFQWAGVLAVVAAGVAGMLVDSERPPRLIRLSFTSPK